MTVERRLVNIYRQFNLKCTRDAYYCSTGTAGVFGLNPGSFLL